jgi:nitrite reductase/ring-hydroxylating ferredoxin subunit
MTLALRTARESTLVPLAPLPQWPLGWYVVARSSEVRPGAVREVALAGQSLVLFRTRTGQLGALDAFCPHMGAHLRHATVQGDALVCPLHRFRFGVDGSVVASSRCERARAHVVEERFGLVFVHLGDVVRASVPTPEAADELVWATGAPVHVDASWHAMAVNGFDMPHLAAVHQRRLVEPAEVVIEDRERLVLRYTSRVIGSGLSDRLMKWLARDRIRVTQHCYGTIVVVQTDLGFTRTAAVLGLLPCGDGVRAHGAFGIRRGLFSGLRVRLTRWLFTAFLRRDFGVVSGMLLRTDVEDEGVRALVTFLRSLPRADS